MTATRTASAWSKTTGDRTGWWQWVTFSCGLRLRTSTTAPPRSCRRSARSCSDEVQGPLRLGRVRLRRERLKLPTREAQTRIYEGLEQRRGEACPDHRRDRWDRP